MTTIDRGAPRVLGLGTAMPPHEMTQESATLLAQEIYCHTDEDRQLMRVLFRRAGVKRRFTTVPHRIAIDWLDEPGSEPERFVDIGGDVATAVASAVTHGPSTARRMKMYRNGAPPLAERASVEALREAETTPDAITHLITVSCTGFLAPGLDAQLIDRLGLSPTVGRLHIGFMGCNGAINGLRTADAIVRSYPNARVLLCAVELCSLHYCFQWDPLRAVGNAVFGDGSAAMVLASGADEQAWRLAAVGSCLIPGTRDAMLWNVGNHGFEMVLSPKVPDLVQANLRGWFETWLGEKGLSIADIGSWAVHPGGPRILMAVEESLGLPRSATVTSREVLAECGNMSSPTVLFILDRLRRASAPRPCVSLAFGPGLVVEAALFV